MVHLYVQISLYVKSQDKLGQKWGVAIVFKQFPD